MAGDIKFSGIVRILMGECQGNLRLHAVYAAGRVMREFQMVTKFKILKWPRHKKIHRFFKVLWAENAF